MVAARQTPIVDGDRQAAHRDPRDFQVVAPHGDRQVVDQVDRQVAGRLEDQVDHPEGQVARPEDPQGALGALEDQETKVNKEVVEDHLIGTDYLGIQMIRWITSGTLVVIDEFQLRRSTRVARRWGQRLQD